MSVKETALKILEENKGMVVSGQKIAEKACASRAAVWKAISQLREEGYIIEASPNKGYVLSLKSDLLSAEIIHHFCKELPKENIYCLKSLESTNLTAKQVAAGGNVDLALIISEEQTNGRGRMKRNFFSPASSGIYMSLLIKPSFNMSKAILVTTAASIAVCRGINSVLGLDCKIKWVNDIYLDGRKIAGILTEGITDFESGQIEHIVIGIGINYSTPIESFPEDIKDIAGSLLNAESEGKNSISSISSKSRNRLIGAIISELIELLSDLDDKLFLDEYRRRSVILGHKVTFSSQTDGQFNNESGVALDIDSNGGLIVLLEDGSKKIINTGEVSVRREDRKYTK
jgi:BirA family biotin operon repressor/biotin-[acetyl-CoA-carboxylase] ligase